jgi:hypothetical protein
MISDYLSYKGHIIKIASITKKKAGYHIKENECRMHYARLCDCKPILITPEMLEKLGFSKTPIDYVSAKCYTLSADKYKLTLFIEDYGKYKRWLLNVESVDANCSNVKCNYLHLLQHTLRLCGISIEIEL